MHNRINLWLNEPMPTSTKLAELAECIARLSQSAGRHPAWMPGLTLSVTPRTTEPLSDVSRPVLAMIALAEGPRMMGNVTGCPIEDVSIGLPVQAYIAIAEPGTGVPFWEPAR